MGRFKIEFTKKAAKAYKRLPGDYKLLIDLALIKLSKGFPVDIKHVAGEVDTYRIRVGKYRILFTIVDDTLLIQKIGTRGDVYK
jgi:mRNA interferase RelE/StbE